MSKPTKDDINFRGFLKAMKKMQRVSNETVAKGLCATSSMSRISRGVVLPKKLTRDRIVARLGVSGEGYEDYLQMDEYDDWSLRQKIIGCVEEKKIEELQKLLSEYSGRKLDKVEMQFLETMRFMMLRMNNAPEKDLCNAIETAVSYTIPVIDNGFPKKLLLADQEINLLIEYVNLHRSCELEAENLKWKMTY